MPSYTKKQIEAIECGLDKEKISLGEGGHLLKNSKPIDDDFLAAVIDRLVGAIKNPEFTCIADIIKYLEHKNRPARAEGAPSANSIAANVICQRLGLIWSDRDGSFHLAPVGEQEIGKMVPFDELEVLVKDEVIDYNEGRDREEHIFAPNILTRMEAMAINARNKKLADVSTTLQYNANGSLDTWVRSLYEFWHIEQDYDIFSTMFKQWMWCVKRRFNSMTATNEIMINIYGSQGSGKTIPITRLLNKVFTRELWSKIRVDTVNDSRERFLWSSKAVLLLDELQGDFLSGAKLGDFKEMVTADAVNYRILGKNKEMSSPKIACMIGTSNFHLFKRMNDSTGMRRFMEFDIDPDAPRIPEGEWLALVDRITDGAVAAFKDINIEATGFWIPDSNNPAMMETNRKIKEIQEGYVDQNPTISWLKETYRFDPTITRAAATIRVGSDRSIPGTIMADYAGNWEKVHGVSDNKGKITDWKTMKEKIIEAFGRDAMFGDTSRNTRLVRIEDTSDQDNRTEFQRIATPSPMPSDGILEFEE